MPTVIMSRSLTTVRSPSNLLYPCKQRGLHPDGLPRQRVQMLQRPSACYRVDRLGNPRGGFLTSLDEQSVVGNGDCLTNTLTQERQFLPVINDWVSLPSIG